jgi:hypothetical protein
MDSASLKRRSLGTLGRGAGTSCEEFHKDSPGTRAQAAPRRAQGAQGAATDTTAGTGTTDVKVATESHVIDENDL